MRHVINLASVVVPRFVGSHAPVRRDLSWFAACLCPECREKPLYYRKQGGRLLTVAEFYNHAVGSDPEDPEALWADITVVDFLSDKVPCRNHQQHLHESIARS